MTSRCWKRAAAPSSYIKYTELLLDSGFQGVAKLHPKSRTAHKRPKGKALTAQQRAHNRTLARARILAEHVIRKLKTFRVLKETYRHRRRRFGLRLNLIAALYNLDLEATV
jgi:hypothetical protein